MQVTHVMTAAPKSCRPDRSLADAAKIMWDHDCGCVPVVDDDDRVIGMVTDRDICMAAFTRGQPLHEIPVSEVMSRNIVRCTPEDPIESALAAMGRARVRRLPVVERKGRLAGILSLHDAARAAETGGWFGGVRLRDVGRALAEISRPHEPQAAEKSRGEPRRDTLGA